MRVFVTGGSGHIGSAVVPELIGAGHEVVALARSDQSAASLEAAGATVQRGSLAELDAIAAAAAAADGVVHLAFDHQAMRSGDMEGAATGELAAVRAVADALTGSDKPFVVTSGTLILPQAGVRERAGTEQDVASGVLRADTENEVAALRERGVRSSVVRLPPITHSTLDTHGFAPTLIAIARARGVAGYVADGANRWPSVHTLDAARVYRLALESAPAGSRLHAVADEGVALRDIAAAIGRGLGVATASIDPADAAEHFGFLGGLVGMDNPVSSALTRRLLGWEPTHPGLIADLDAGFYFRAG